MAGSPKDKAATKKPVSKSPKDAANKKASSTSTTTKLDTGPMKVPVAAMVEKVITALTPSLTKMVTEAVTKALEEKLGTTLLTMVKDVVSEACAGEFTNIQKLKDSLPLLDSDYKAKLAALQTELNELKQTMQAAHESYGTKFAEYKKQLWEEVKDYENSLEEDMKKFQLNIDRDGFQTWLYVDQQEMYERRDCIIIRNLREFGPNEDLYEIVGQMVLVMGGSIQPADISVVHRLGRFTRGQTRDVIVKFTRRRTKSMVMRHKHVLRRSRGWETVFVEENLTKWRAMLVSLIARQDSVSGLHTSDGKIFFKKNNRQYVLNSPHDFLTMPFGAQFLIDANINPDICVPTSD